MRIKKKEPSVGVLGKIVNLFSNSKQDTYSCDYINHIVESGSNENGGWTKWSDGTMIQYGSKPTGTYSLPQSFVSNAFIYTTPNNNSPYFAHVSKATVTQNEYTIVAFYSAEGAEYLKIDTSVFVNWFAIGKWK